MVLPAPPAHDEVPPAAAGWVDGIRLGLRLSGAGGILLHVDRAVPERLGDLVRGLVGEYPELDVHTDLGAVETVAEGSATVLILRPEHAEALNLGRPIFERRRLKVVLWCDHETTLALMDHAPDFFDWVSGHYECPAAGPVAHAVAGLRAAYAAGAPGVVWRGTGDQDDNGRLRAAFAAAFPKEPLTRIDPRRDYEFLLDEVRGAKEAWIACRAQAASHVRRLRWAMAEAGKMGRAILVAETYPCPGWWPVHGRLMPFGEARRALDAAGSSQPGALAALVGSEPEALEMVVALVARGMRCDRIVTRLLEEIDPGQGLARAAQEGGVAQMDDVARAHAPAPMLRAFGGTQEVAQRRRDRAAAFWASCKRGDPVSIEDMGLWAASWQVDKLVVNDRAGVEMRAFAVEARLRHGSTAGSGIALARSAVLVGEPDAAQTWALRSTQEEGVDREQELKRIAIDLARLDYGYGATIEPEIRKVRRLRPGFVEIALVVLLVGALGYAIVDIADEVRGRVGGRDAVHVLVLVAWVLLAWLGRMLLDFWRRSREERDDAFTRRLGVASQRIRDGGWGDARRLCEELALDARLIRGEEHPLSRRASALLSCLYVEQAENKSALTTLATIIVLEGRLRGVDRESFAALILPWATALTRTGAARDAEVLLRKVLGPEAPAPLPGDDAPEPLTHTLAPSGSANEYLQDFLALPTPPLLSDAQRADARRGLAEAWIAQERYDEAERLLQRAVEQADRTLPPDHPERWRTRTTYGRVLYFQGRPAEAEAPLHRALSLAEKHAGPRHPDTGRILAELARVEHRLGRPEAPATAKRALAVLEAAQIAGTEKELARGELAPIATVAP